MSVAPPAVLDTPQITSTFTHRTYQFGKLIGRGGNSEVYRAVSEESPGEAYAVKVVSKRSMGGDQKRVQNLLREIEIMHEIHHANVLSLSDLTEDVNNLYLVTKFMGGGDLFNKVIGRGHFTERDAAKVMKQILEGIAYLHSKGICHRDLKPENILCSDEQNDFVVVISDFGFSKLFGRGELMQTACGTLQYAAPEIFSSHKYTQACDMWTVGVICYVLLTGCFPFDGTYDDILGKISKADYCKTNLAHLAITPDATDFMDKLLMVNPMTRMTAMQALANNWITTHTRAQPAGAFSSLLSLDLLKRHVTSTSSPQTERRTFV
eukprot:TRINITY_DN7394_c0_g1_i1.p1 TRINITY_DN7394_c0_g1~~TRINITY_DN7394_c0_g1_i1.p1  ORF type:complete len:322 (+),score=74.45 TRINITY_DN7394_c0_g1_i1:62-1027(+)